MQFVLEQQAQLTATVGQLAAKVDRIDEAQANTAQQIAHLGDAMIALTEAHTRTEVALATLAEAHTRTTGALTELAQAQAHSDQRLDALIDIVQSKLGKG